VPPGPLNRSRDSRSTGSIQSCSMSVGDGCWTRPRGGVVRPAHAVNVNARAIAETTRGSTTIEADVGRVMARPVCRFAAAEQVRFFMPECAMPSARSALPYGSLLRFVRTGRATCARPVAGRGRATSDESEISSSCRPSSRTLRDEVRRCRALDRRRTRRDRRAVRA